MTWLVVTLYLVAGAFQVLGLASAFRGLSDLWAYFRGRKPGLRSIMLESARLRAVALRGHVFRARRPPEHVGTPASGSPHLGVPGRGGATSVAPLPGGDDEEFRTWVVDRFASTDGRIKELEQEQRAESEARVRSDEELSEDLQKTAESSHLATEQVAVGGAVRAAWGLVFLFLGAVVGGAASICSAVLLH